MVRSHETLEEHKNRLHVRGIFLGTSWESKPWRHGSVILLHNRRVGKQLGWTCYMKKYRLRTEIQKTAHEPCRFLKEVSSRILWFMYLTRDDH